MLLIVAGSDAYRVQKKREELTAHFRSKFDTQGWNVHQASGERDAWASTASLLAGGDLFGSRRFVIVSGLLSELTRKDDAELWANRLLALGEKTIVVLEDVMEAEALDKHKLLPFVQGKDGVFLYACHALLGRELVAWIAQHGRENGAVWSAAACERLAQARNDGWWLATAIATISAGAMGEVQPSDVDAYAAAPMPDQVFAFVDAIRTGNTAQASRALASERARGTEPMALVALCARDVQTLAKVWACVQLGEQPNPADIGAHPYAVKKLTPIARALTREQLAACVGRVLAADEAVKTGKATPDQAIEMLACGA
jgi:DNA polymerase III delta subunit